MLLDVREPGSNVYSMATLSICMGLNIGSRYDTPGRSQEGPLVRGGH